jgi:hypothetical protein
MENEVSTEVSHRPQNAMIEIQTVTFFTKVFFEIIIAFEFEWTQI